MVLRGGRGAAAKARRKRIIGKRLREKKKNRHREFELKSGPFQCFLAGNTKQRKGSTGGEQRGKDPKKKLSASEREES